MTVIEGNLPDEVADEGDKIKGTSDTAQAAPALPSCLFRHDSVRASIKKKVRCSEAAEVIPQPNYYVNNDWREMPHDDDDDVFSDSAPVQTPRGNMCTPFIERKGSLPGPEALPDWFPNSRLLSISIKSITFYFLLSCHVVFVGIPSSSVVFFYLFHCAFVCLRNIFFVCIKSLSFE